MNDPTPHRAYFEGLVTGILFGYGLMSIFTWLVGVVK